MARLLVAADPASIAQRGMAQRLVERLVADGHDAEVARDAPVTACSEADGVLALIDGTPAPLVVAFAAVAHAQAKPVLALHSAPLAADVATLFTQASSIATEADVAAALPPFYAHVRPHAGKLVRDLVPRLVREAGHAVQFREAAAEERPRYLKRKVSDEAAELLAADPGQEREEVADLLEALEALIRERGYDRDDLKLVKDAKRKRRGAFERCFVVEAASAHAAGVDDTLTQGILPPWPGESVAGAPATPTAATTLPPPAEPARTRLWNLGLGGKPEPIPPKREDPDSVEPSLREV